MMETFKQSLWTNRDINAFLNFLQRFALHQSLFSNFKNSIVLIGSTQLACNELGVHNPRYVETLYASPQRCLLCVDDQYRVFQT